MLQINFWVSYHIQKKRGGGGGKGVGGRRVGQRDGIRGAKAVESIFK